MTRTFEVETVHYSQQGVVKKTFDLFDSKNKAHKYMRDVIKEEQNMLHQQGKIRDGVIRLLDDKGMLRQVLTFSEL